MLAQSSIIMVRVSIITFLSSLIKTVRFQFHRIKEHNLYGKYEFVYREELINKRCYVLANGPSLNEELETLKNDKSFVDSPKFVLNYFVESDYFQTLKPEFYCLADPLFFSLESSDRNKKIIKTINEDTKWPMSLFYPNNGGRAVCEVITNPNVNLIPISVLRYEGFEKNKYPYYKSGKAVPSYVNVTIMIEYILLNMGCKDIRLYGVDHTFFDGMTVDDENIPCMIDRHFYGDEFIRIFDCHGNYVTVSEWLMDKYLTFKEHENMRGYADYLGARIVNCTKGSLIDAYTRLAQIEKSLINI